MWRPVCETPAHLQDGIDGHAMCPYWDSCRHWAWDTEPEECLCYREGSEAYDYLLNAYRLWHDMDYNIIVSLDYEE